MNAEKGRLGAGDQRGIGGFAKMSAWRKQTRRVPNKATVLDGSKTRCRRGWVEKDHRELVVGVKVKDLLCSSSKQLE